ncbi:MAG: hypothetical protein KC731_08645 [Myxococcales bacterium]|nr:hypothetical protein [Myxococcales bacterium]
MNKSLLALGSSSLVILACACGGSTTVDTTTGGSGGTGDAGGAGATGGTTSTGGQGATGGAGASGGSGGGGGGASFACGDEGLVCNDPQICVKLTMLAGPMETITWECRDDPCAPAPLACSCAQQPICGSGGPGIADCQVNMGVLECTSGGICASGDTPIDTPDGERPIRDLRAGDLVYSLEAGRRVTVPLLRVVSRAVTGHAVARVELSNGRVLHISQPHPTVDGGSFGDLAPGSRLGDVTVIAAATVPYGEPSTYDILPASSSGAYLAAGAWIGSTLAR